MEPPSKSDSIVNASVSDKEEESNTNIFRRCISKRSSTWYHKSYILDGLVAFGLFVIVGIINLSVEPYHRYLPPNDPMVTYPNKPDIVPIELLIVISLVLPIIVFLVFFLKNRSSHDLHHAFLGLMASIFITNIFTAALKMAAGRYRPDWLSTFAATDDNEGRYSFPSGHASNVFSGMTFLVLYLCGKTNLFSEHRTTSFAKAVLVMSPMVLAFFVAVSRTMDYHHNFSDIIAGSLIGLACSMCTYYMYFPSLFHPLCHLSKLHESLVRKKDERSTLLEVTVDSYSSTKQEVEHSPLLGETQRRYGPGQESASQVY